MKKWMSYVFSLVIILSSLSILIVMPEDVSGVGDPDVQIILTQTKQTAYVAPGQDGVVTFTGEVRADIPWAPSVQYLVVTLTAYCEGWAVSGAPSLTFNRAVSVQNFQISVQVPIGTPRSTNAILYINGTWMYSPGVSSGDCEGATAIIVIKQYYSFTISPVESVSYVEGGGVGEMPFLVENLGNGDESIGIEVENAEQLLKEGIHASLSRDSISIPYGGEEEIFVILRTDNSVLTDLYPVDIVIWSQVAESVGAISDREKATGYLEVVREGSLPEPEPKPEPDPDPEPEPEPDDDVEDPIEDPVDDPSDIDETFIDPETKSGIGIWPFIVGGGVLLFIFTLVGIYIFTRKGKKAA